MAGLWKTRWWKPELEVGRDPLDRLVGVGRADEARRRVLVVEVLVGEPLELDGVVDALLHLGGQRERGPEAAVASAACSMSAA